MALLTFNHPKTTAATSGADAAQVAALQGRISELETRLLRQRQTETQFLESEQHYRALFDHNLDAVITVDRNGRIVTATPPPCACQATRCRTCAACPSRGSWPCGC
jgi:PAS domain-containing protein